MNEALFRSMVFVAGLILMALLALLDNEIRPERLFSVLFYLIPICLVAWFSGLWQGVLISALVVFVKYKVESLHGRVYSDPLDFIWEGGVRLVFFQIITALLVALKRELLIEKIMARTDYLTGLANRRNFLESAEMEISRSERYKRPFSAAYIDVDDFKKINDTYGHNAGDKVLKMIAKIIGDNIRKTDLAARLGGDEFALLLPETDKNSAKMIMQKIHSLLSASTRSFSFRITFSAGSVTFENPPFSADEMVKIADELMYGVKKSGKNNVKYKTVN